MFDFIQVELRGKKAKEIQSLPFLEFITEVSLDTGELISKVPGTTEYRSKFGDFNISIKNEKYISLRGSLHKHFHGNNYVDFSNEEALNTIDVLSSKLKIDPSSAIIHNLEFGVNVLLPFPVSTLLKSVYFYKGEEPGVRKFQRKGYMKKFTLTQYEVKLYDKGKQYNIDKNFFRFEIKVRTMQYLHNKGVPIRVLEDLKNEDYQNRLGQILLSTLDRILIVEDCKESISKMSKPEKRIYSECRDPLFWSQLYEDNPLKYRKRFKKNRELNNKCGRLKLHETVYKKVAEKWDQLTAKRGTEISRDVLNSGSEISGKKFNEDKQSSTDIRLQIGPNNNSSGNGKRVCKYCGSDLSNKKNKVNVLVRKNGRKK